MYQSNVVALWCQADDIFFVCRIVARQLVGITVIISTLCVTVGISCFLAQCFKSTISAVVGDTYWRWCSTSLFIKNSTQSIGWWTCCSSTTSLKYCNLSLSVFWSSCWLRGRTTCSLLAVAVQSLSMRFKYLMTFFILCCLILASVKFTTVFSNLYTPLLSRTVYYDWFMNCGIVAM